MEKYAARTVKQQIDRILWEVWDPGICAGICVDRVSHLKYSSPSQLASSGWSTIVRGKLWAHPERQQ
jgi:hypothetical protein